jgi:prephenate dehydrogenase
MQQIGILGVGLIGGSLGLAWKSRVQDVHITGYDDLSVLETAIRRGAIDAMAESIEEAVSGADLVVLAAPIRQIMNQLKLIAPDLKEGAIVHDIGSVKRPILEHARQVLPEHVTYIGGHPMAGSERRGIEHSDALLFENATYVVCPPEELDEAAFISRFPRFISLIEATGARLLMLDADRHDQIAATVSHLPQLVAVALMNYASERNREDDAFLKLAAGGFRDMTRIASSPFHLWRDIIVANEGPILDALAGFVSQVQRVRDRVGEEDLDTIERMFSEAQSAREFIPRDTKGFLHPLSDLYVYAEDRPGELLSIVSTLYDASINIKDIELLKIREGRGGAFRIGFSDEETANKSASVLTEAGYTAYRL